MAHSVTDEHYAGETHTDPLEQSQWSIDAKGVFVYFDFEFLPDETCLLHAVIDDTRKNFAENFEKFRVVDRGWAAVEAQRLVRRALEYLTDFTGLKPHGAARAAAFIIAVDRAGVGDE